VIINVRLTERICRSHCSVGVSSPGSVAETRVWILEIHEMRESRIILKIAFDRAATSLRRSPAELFVAFEERIRQLATLRLNERD